MIKLKRSAKHIDILENGSLYFSVYGSSGGRYHSEGDYPGSIVWEKDWIIKNKCKFLGIHPIKDIEFIEFGGGYRAVIKPNAIDKIKNKFPKFKEWIEEKRIFSNSACNWEYADFSFVKGRDNPNACDNILLVEGGFCFGDWLFDLNLVGVRD